MMGHMHRRNFLATSLAASASTALPAQNASQPRTGDGKAEREFYLLRRFYLQTGPQTAQAEHFFAEALLPALGRMNFGPAGVFKLDIGPETPTYYLLLSAPSVEALALLDARLAQDEAFLKVAEPFWAAPATTPAFHRTESTLLHAFEGWPKLTPPTPGAPGGKRIFQLRTYESPSYAAHLRKVEMFHQGEFALFQHAGLRPVFFAQGLVGARLPSLTYMLTFPDMRTLEANWANFSGDPAWKKLSTSPRYAYEAIVSNISNLILSPLACSQL
jgi:hypothetical protein